MANSTIDLKLYPYGKAARKATWGVDGAAVIYRGTFVSQLTATGMLVAGSTANSGQAVGVATHAQDATGVADGVKRLEFECDGVFLMANSGTDPLDEGDAMFREIYMEDDHTVAKTDASATLEAAGLFMGVEEDGRIRVYVGMRP